jgi:hypothetical protein
VHQLEEPVLELLADDLAGTVAGNRPLQHVESRAAVCAFNGGIQGVQVEEL